MQQQNSSDRMRITYRVACTSQAEAKIIATDIANEQTVEVPPSCIPQSHFDRGIVGIVEDVKPDTDSSHYKVIISYHPDVTGYAIPQLFNVIFGNISLKNNIRITNIDFCESLYKAFKGPQFGIDGLRNMAGAFKRPLACTALKPMGQPVSVLAHLAASYAAGGIDFIKDDHGIGNQAYHPFEERVEACANAIARVNSHTQYMPMVSGRFDQIESQVQCVVAHGLKGILIAPMLVGFDAVRYISEKYKLAILGHPAWTGGYFACENHGLDPSVLLGTLYRLLGADASIFPNAGGRFPFSQSECNDLTETLRKPMGPWKPTFPSPAGGMQIGNVPALINTYGNDTLLLIGGSLMQQLPNVTSATCKLMELLAEYERV